MRLYEFSSFLFYAGFGLLGWLRPLSRYRRAIVTGIAAVGIAGIITLRQTAIRNWLPVALIPMAYWQTGQFVGRFNHVLQSKLESMDRKYFRIDRPHFVWIFEFAYLFCYPLIPLGFVYVYASGLTRFAEQFWNVVLPPAYACYATFPFLRTLPPREFQPDELGQRHPIRKLNLLVLRQMSIHANTFPSGHIAASIGVSLALLPHAPSAGAVFILISLAIAVGAVLGRYHYGLDVVLGALLAIMSFLLNVFFVSSLRDA